jgi:NAD(P)-dependent dehydrogenase (short-subunit alcohol dehydrogenase family)
MGMVQGKTIVVTGGASGIGQAAARLFASEGAQVVIVDLQEEKGYETVDQIVKANGTAEYHNLDVSSYEQYRGLVEDVAGRYGSLDGAFNNAGIEAPSSKITKQSLEDWQKVIKVNMTGVYVCLKCEVEQMLLQKQGGSIVNTASVAGLIGVQGASTYNASKHGVVGITKTVALEYAKKNIRVNAVCPGSTETAMLERLTGASENLAAYLDSVVAMGRVAAPAEVAEGVLWLLSDRSSYVTGIALPVDGGYTAG